MNRGQRPGLFRETSPCDVCALFQMHGKRAIPGPRVDITLRRLMVTVCYFVYCAIRTMLSDPDAA